jgi:hypothetical protein
LLLPRVKNQWWIATTGSEKQSHAAKIFRVKDQWWIAAVASSNINIYNRKSTFFGPDGSSG